MRKRHAGSKVGLGIILCSLALTPAGADHCSEDSMAKGKPEIRLAGIGFERGGFEQVLRRFGLPSQGASRGCSPDSGDADYVWVIGSTKLQVFTGFYCENRKRIESVTAVMLIGDAGAPGFQTGRGIHLGDPFSAVKRAYGTKYLEGWINGPRLAGETKTFCFEDETELEFGISHKGRVTSIFLSPSQE
jgi:hypothetical protein